MQIVVANPPGILDNGKYIVPFASRCDWIGDYKAETTYYPYDLGYLTTMLKQAGYNARLMDGHLTSIPAAEYTEQIQALEPSIFVAECAHLSYPTMTRILNDLKAQRPTKGILCGPFGTTYPGRARLDGWDVVIEREFQDKVLAEIMGRPYPTGPVDPNTLPFPDNEDLPRIAYWEQNCATKPMVQVYASRGCTMRCGFCVAPIYYGGYDAKGYTLTRHPDNVLAEVEYLLDTYPGLPGVFFDEENHAANIRWLRALANRIIERGLNGIAYEAMCGYWTFKQADIELLARAGYKKLRLGVESLATETAGGKGGKRVAQERLTNVLTWCKDNGIRVHLYTMIGVPGSSERGDLSTLEALIAYKAYKMVESIQHSVCTPNPGTLLHQQCIDNGWLTSLDPLDYHWHSPVIDRPEYPAERVRTVASAYAQYAHLEYEVVKP